MTVIYEGRTGQRVGVEQDAHTGRLVAVHLEQRDGTFKKLKRAPRWLAPGLWHARCALHNVTGKGERPCSECVPSLHAREAIARAKRTAPINEPKANPQHLESP